MRRQSRPFTPAPLALMGRGAFGSLGPSASAFALRLTQRFTVGKIQLRTASRFLIYAADAGLTIEL